MRIGTRQGGGRVAARDARPPRRGSADRSARGLRSCIEQTRLPPRLFPDLPEESERCALQGFMHSALLAAHYPLYFLQMWTFEQSQAQTFGKKVHRRCGARPVGSPPLFGGSRRRRARGCLDLRSRGVRRRRPSALSCSVSRTTCRVRKQQRRVCRRPPRRRLQGQPGAPSACRGRGCGASWRAQVLKGRRAPSGANPEGTAPHTAGGPQAGRHRDSK